MVAFGLKVTRIFKAHLREAATVDRPATRSWFPLKPRRVVGAVVHCAKATWTERFVS